VRVVDFQALRVLVADDNAHMRRIIRAILHGLGVREVYEAADGAEAVEQFIAHAPDVVVADWVMPILDGIEMTRMMRDQKSSVNPFVPIIMVSGHSERAKVMAARDAGVTEFMCKPISAKALHDRFLSVVLQPRQFVRTKTFFGPDRRRFIHPNYNGSERRGPAQAAQGV